MSKLVDEKTMKALKQLRDSLDHAIALYEKDEEEVTEDEAVAVMGRLMMAFMTMEALK